MSLKYFGTTSTLISATVGFVAVIVAVVVAVVAAVAVTTAPERQKQSSVLTRFSLRFRTKNFKKL